MNGLFYFCCYSLYLRPLTYFLTRGRRSRDLVRVYLTGWWAKATEPLHCIRSRSLRLLAYARLDVALGIGIRGSGGHCHGGLEPG